MAPKIVDKEAKKIEILHAAIRVFSEKGAAKTKMIDIAIAAKIGKGTIYEYFRSKEEVFAGTFTLFYQGMESMLLECVHSTDDPEEQLCNLVNVSLVEMLEHGGEFINIMMDFWAESVRTKNEEIRSIINLKKIYDEFRALVVGILDAGIAKGVFRPIDSHVMASFFIGALDGLMLQEIMDPGIIDMKKAAGTICDCFINGIKK